MKRLTKIYEDCEGFIRAVAFEDEKAVNIITLATDIEPSGLTGGKRQQKQVGQMHGSLHRATGVIGPQLIK